MNLALPMVGVGLSYDVDKAAGVAALMAVGSLYACGVSMLFPVEKPAIHPQATPTEDTPTLGYGLRLGLAGATAAAVGFALGLDHVGWACAAALLVMRPAREMQQLRSVGRLASVLVGALLAIALLHSDPGAGWLAAAVFAAIGGASATASSWYVTPAFTTFLVFLVLLYSSPQDAGWRFPSASGRRR